MESEFTEKATISDQFTILYETLEKHNERYVKGSMSVTALLLVVVGWLLNPENIQKIFSGNIWVTLGALLLIAGLIWVHHMSMVRIYDVNHRAYKLLNELNYMDQKFYNHHKITNKTKHFGLWINCGIYIVIGILIAKNQWQLF